MTKTIFETQQILLNIIGTHLLHTITGSSVLRRLETWMEFVSSACEHINFEMWKT